MSSGGVDSSLLLFFLKKEGYEILPLHVNYGHLAENNEWASCKKICDYLELSEPTRIDMTGISRIPSGLTNNELHIEKDAFLPTRNLLFATVGAAYAYSRSSNLVAIGLLANPIFPDQSQEFVGITENCISTALGSKIKILTPFITLDKREILKLAQKHSLPLSIMYYCHSGKEQPCRICISCKERIAAELTL